MGKNELKAGNPGTADSGLQSSEIGMQKESEEISVSRGVYFPTLIYSHQIENPEALNQKLLELTYAERERDTEGINRSNFPQLGGWHSHTKLHESPEYGELVDRINKVTQHVSDDLGYDTGRKLTIGTMWSIINPPGSSNLAHIHPNCYWSGVYYVQTPANCGNIEFIDPRTGHLMNQPAFVPGKRRPRNSWTKVRFTPSPGKLLVFPSWVYHAVHPNGSIEKGNDGNRVIISFNVQQRTRRSK